MFHAPTLKVMIRLLKEGIARGLFLTRRIGKGGAVKNAVLYTRGRYLIILDADVPVGPVANTKRRFHYRALKYG